MGVLYDDQKKDEEAKKYYLLAIQKDEDYSLPYNNLGALYKDQKKYEEAEKYYCIAIEKDNTDFLPYRNLCNLYENQVRYDDAIKLLNSLPMAQQDNSWKALLERFQVLSSQATDTSLIPPEKLQNLEEAKIINQMIQHKIKGFIISVDLCNSTEYKKEKEEKWFKRLLHFYQGTESFLKSSLIRKITDEQEKEDISKRVHVLKYIGDEVMLFIEFDSKKDTSIKSILLSNLIFFLENLRKNLNENYFIKYPDYNANNFDTVLNYEKHSDKIDIKVVITYAEDLIKYDMGKTFDILGVEVDFWSRIKELCKENMILVNDSFQAQYQSTNHGQKFINLKGFDLKGISDQNYKEQGGIYFMNYENILSRLDLEYVKKHTGIYDTLIGRLILEHINRID